MIYMTSRYSTGPLEDIQLASEPGVRKTVFREWPRQEANFTVYTWKDGDRIDLLANRFYGTSDAWWQIMDWNPELVDPTSVLPGTDLRLPL